MLIDAAVTNHADMLMNKRKLLRRVSNITGMSISVRIVGGYTTNELSDWLKIYCQDYNINVDVKSLGWGSALQIINTCSDEMLSQIDLIIILPFYDTLAYPPSDVELREIGLSIMTSLQTFYDRCAQFNITIIQCDFPAHPTSLPRQQDIGKLINAIIDLNKNIFIQSGKNANVVPCYLSQMVCRFGVRNWYDRRNWFLFGDQLSAPASLYFGKNLAILLGAIYSVPKKVLILDLDNTLWGGVIGDDGINNIKIGPDTTQGRPFYEFQRYVRKLKDSGIILAICSKNEYAIAIEGLNHQGMCLKLEDFSAIKVGWNSKSIYISEIAAELNLGLSSFVFVDDNPVEREQVRTALPDVAVPDIGNNVSDFIDAIDDRGYFYSNQILTKEDELRIESYAQNRERSEALSHTGDEHEFLMMLKTRIIIAQMANTNVERIVQLFNKTNQFNLKTLRIAPGDVESIRENEIVFCYDVSDKFGAYGIVAAIRLKMLGNRIEIVNWVMSCRVFKRRIEYAIFNWLVTFCRNKGIGQIEAEYLPTEKNGVIRNLLPSLGFSEMGVENGMYRYSLKLDCYTLDDQNFCEVSYVE
ncbi:MAG: HAD-IIIC family phosphatase [Magnetococcales bacterium]|nr:HAD-IIIC family phosphatase [Magnetococcales bacterium]